MLGDVEERDRRLAARRGAIPSMAELRRFRVNLGQVPTFPARAPEAVPVVEVIPAPVDPETTKEQVRQLSDVLVYGPLLVMSGLGRSPPRWVRAGMLIIGVGTIVYRLSQYFETTRNAQLGQMTAGPMHRLRELDRLADMRRSTVVQRQLMLR